MHGIGCGVLRDGVYLLPAGAAQVSDFVDLESDVKAAGGFAMAVELNFRTSAQFERVRKLFDRTREYTSLVAQINAAKKSLSRLGQARTDTLVKRLNRSFQETVKIDFYPGQSGRQAQAALAGLDDAVRRLYSTDEPHRAKGRIRRLDPLKYQGRTWATRKNPWVDRLASAWLIKRFVDRKARFIWIDKPKHRPKGALGFDFDGADFTHLGNRVTFEVLLASFGLDSDPALSQLAAIIHFLDAGGIPVDDAKGLETILKGARGKARSDDELFLAAARVFDHMYSAYQSAQSTP
ncbi:MAG: chromate resistance protein [Sulfuricaulis sp.]|nr:chromate resistance protein [Sulfuricaulis sp.]